MLCGLTAYAFANLPQFQDRLACLMVTYPSTRAFFEDNIQESHSYNQLHEKTESQPPLREFIPVETTGCNADMHFAETPGKAKHTKDLRDSARVRWTSLHGWRHSVQTIGMEKCTNDHRDWCTYERCFLVSGA